MANTIKIKRGLKKDIDKLTLVAGELGVALDTQELYVGDANGNKQLVVGKASGTVTSAEKLATARVISATGDATGSVAFDGSKDVEIALTLANSGVKAGTYNNITVDEKGRITNISGALDLTVEIEDVIGLSNVLANKVDKDGNKVLSDNNYTNEHKSIVEGITARVNAKADATDVAALSTTVGTLETDLANLTQTVETKASQENLEALDSVVTEHTNTIATLATKTELSTAQSTLQNAINTKADAGNVYTKSEVDSSLGGKADKATTLGGYGITDAYTKTEVDGMVAGAFHFKGEKATYEELPTNPSAGDVWQVGEKEYAWDGNSWVELGFNIDLSAYAKTADVAATYATQASVNTELAKKANSADVYTKTEIDGTVQTINNNIATKANSADVYLKTETYNKTEIDNYLDDKADAATTLEGYGITNAYTKTEITELLADKLTTSSVIDGGTFGA